VSWLDEVSYNADGLVAAVAQDYASGEILMLAWMSRASLARTWELGEAVYWSRSKGRFWHKGESSGHTQRLRELWLDCDGDTVVLKVEQVGGIACHTGHRSCFYRRLSDNEWVTTEQALRDPETIYGGGGSE
jgi:phosphoribosyl-AMP cyclohydrolase